MADRRILPYFHPTTVIFIDDSAAFLSSLDLQLSPGLAYRMFTSPVRALERINARRATPPLYVRCFSHYRRDDEDDAQRLIHLDLNLIEQEVSNPQRFRDVSVVVVDYDMPAMAGLELIRNIDDKRIKTILLTGVADEKVAVQAFNSGIIDRFIRKNESDAIDKLNKAIVELQHEYFDEISQMLKGSLMLKSPSFLQRAEFETFFEQLRQQHDFVEYYLVENPRGFLLLSAGGRVKRLIVCDDKDLKDQIQLARKYGAPSEYIARLQRGESIAYFYDFIDEYFDRDACNWSDYFFPAHRLESDAPTYHAILENPPVDIEFDAESSTYHSYLRSLDD